MVRNYKRKTSKGADTGSYSKDDLKKAVEDVNNGNKTVYGAAVFYGIPRSTLRHNIFGTRGKGITSGGGKGGGGKNKLSDEVEEELANSLNAMQKWGFGLSKQEVLDLVQTYVKKNKIRTPFKDDRPGEEWFLNFCKRKHLSLKKPQGVEAARKKQENPWTIFGFFDLLEKTFEELDLINKPERVYNCDETSFSSDPSKTKILGDIGSKCTRTISSSGRENTTVLVCCSAAGQKLPLLTIFKGKNVIESMIPEQLEPVDKTAFAASDRGWMTTKIFAKWFVKCFLPNISNDRPILLIVDGHVSHISCELIEKAIQNGVVILKLPPHSTHLLQPLDVGVFRGMKAQWDKALCKWQRMNPRKKIPKQEFVRILNEEYTKMPEKNIINSFKATGIYNGDMAGPDRQQISKDVFLKSDLLKYQNKSTAMEMTSNEVNDDGVVVVSELTNQDSTLSSCRTGDEGINQESTSGMPTSFIKDAGDANQESVPGTLSSCNEEATNIAIPGCSNSKLNQIINDEPKQRPSSGSSQATSFDDILVGLLRNQEDRSKITPPPPKRRRLCVGAEILTTDEYLNKKKEEEENKRLKEMKKTKTPKMTSCKKKKADDVNKIPLKEKSKANENKKLNISAKRRTRFSSDSSVSTLDSVSTLEKEIEENYIDEEDDLIDDALSVQDDEVDEHDSLQVDDENTGLELDTNVSRKLHDTNLQQDLKEVNTSQEPKDSNEHVKVDLAEFVLCTFIYDEGTKKETSKQFICKVTAINDGEYEVTCLRKHKDYFIFPNVPDIATVTSYQIKKKLPLPTEKRGKFYFNEFSLSFE